MLRSGRCNWTICLHGLVRGWQPLGGLESRQRQQAAPTAPAPHSRVPGRGEGGSFQWKSRPVRRGPSRNRATFYRLLFFRRTSPLLLRLPAVRQYFLRPRMMSAAGAALRVNAAGLLIFYWLRFRRRWKEETRRDSDGRMVCRANKSWEEACFSKSNVMI